MSDAFARAYEFELAEGSRERRNQVGLHFAPTDLATGKVQIDGTLWVDTVARELRDVEFRYVGLPLAKPVPNSSIRAAQSPGAEDLLARRTSWVPHDAEDGVTIIDRWSIRLVRTAVDTVVELGNGRIGFDAPKRLGGMRKN